MGGKFCSLRKISGYSCSIYRGCLYDTSKSFVRVRDENFTARFDEPHFKTVRDPICKEIIKRNVRLFFCFACKSIRGNKNDVKIGPN